MCIRDRHEIAQELYISERTLYNHIQSIYDKLGATNAIEAYNLSLIHISGADNRIAPGNNTVPFPEISAPLIFVGAVTCCDASYRAVHCRISHRKRRSPPQA